MLTNYKVQGKDAPYGVGLMESYHRFGASIKNFYVQISRAINGMTLVTDDKESLVRAIQKNNDDKSSSLDVINSHKLKAHSERFIDKINIDLNPVINRKVELENANIYKNINRNNSEIMNKNVHQKSQKELEI